MAEQFSLVGNPVQMNEGMEAIADLMEEVFEGGTPGTDVPVLRLFKNDLTPVKTHVVASFVEADFDGYAGIDMDAWTPGFDEELQKAVLRSALLTFTATGAVTSNVIYGYYITNNAGTLVYCAERFSITIFVDETGDSIAVVSRFPFVPNEPS